MIPKYFIDRPIFAWVIALLILLGGGLALRHLPVSQYPEVAPPALAVTANYPGASAKTVEESVAAIIEQEMNGIEHLIYMDSTSDATGSMTLTLTFEPGTNLDISSVEAQNRIRRVEARLPDDVRRLGVQVAKSRRNYLMFVAIFSPDKSRDLVALGSYAAASVLDPLRRVPGVGEATLFGTEYSMRIWLDPAKLTAYRLTPGDVTKAVRAENVQLATGEVGQLPAVAGQQLNATIVTSGRLHTPEEFGNIILRANHDGSSVRLQDVARVELGAQDYGLVARLNGQPTAAVGIKLAPDSNALQTSAAVRAKMTELARYFPNGISWVVPYDTTTFIKISIEEVVKTLVEAIGLVFLVILLFLGSLRATFIPMIVVPIALTGALVGLYLLGYSINVLTLFAMVLATGILVDDAIVVVENVERIMREEGLAPREASRKAMEQIFGAIIGITLVLSAVFVPMAFFGGSTGAIYRQFAVTLVLTMLFSALMALTLTPALCATLLKRGGHESGWHAHTPAAWFNRFFARLSARYQGGVARVLRKSTLYLLVYGVLIVITLWMFTRLPGSFLPEEDQGYFVTMVQLPPGATQERTVGVLSQVEQHYLKESGVAKVVGIAGFSFMGRGQSAGLSFTRLTDWDLRTKPEEQIGAMVQEANMAFSRIKQAFIFAINVPPIPELAAVGGFDFRLEDRSGVGRERLFEARNQLLGMASQNPILVGVHPEGQEPGPQLFLDIDRLKARSLGIDLADLNETLQSAYGVAYINDFIREGRVLRVQMQADASVRARPEDMMKLHIRNTQGEIIPLSEIATPHWIQGSPKLDRYNGFPSMKIGGSAAPGHTTSEAMQAMTEIAQKLPTGIGYEWSGTAREEMLSGAQAPLLFSLSILVVFLCLAALYESWSIPVAVLLVVPLGVFGAVVATQLRGLPNDVYFKVGLIAIIGLAAKNAILIIQYAKHLYEDQGMDITAATREACRLRFRPILMTSIAFIFGVLPLAISTGAGAASRHAIGTGVIGGMIGATVLAVFLVPVFFVVVRRFFPGKRRGEPNTGPSAATTSQESGQA